MFRRDKGILHRFLFTMLAFPLAGCGRGPGGDELVVQTKRILLEARPGCTIDVTFNGIGEPA